MKFLGLNPADYVNPIKYVPGEPFDKRAWRDFENGIVDRFRTDLLAALKLTDHPKAAALWELAWDRGHSAGLDEVATYADEFSVLLK